MSLFADSRLYTPGNPPPPLSSITTITTPITTSPTSGTITITTETPPSTTPSVPTPRPNFQYLGCVNEGNDGRALTKDATANSTLTIEYCQDYCTGKGYPLSGMEFSTECYCGFELEHGSTIGGSTGCVMACGGNSEEICGGSGALSVYNNTALLPPKVPITIPNVDNFISQGCYTEGVGEHALAGSTTAISNMTVATCVNFCKQGGFRFAGVEYSTECYCGASIAATAGKAPITDCNMLCGGDAFAYCGGPGRLNVYAAPVSNSTTSPPTSSPTPPVSTPPVITTPSTVSTEVPAPTTRPGFSYVGCANEGLTGRALSKDSFANSTMTLERCQDYCTGKGYPLSGVEFASECYCGDNLENGSTIGGSTQCTMACGGNPAAICGGPSALSVYNNTALIPPKAPATVPGVGTYLSQGCYTEGVEERALADRATAATDMTVAKCVGFCKDAGFRYAGLEYSTECYCGAVIAVTAVKAAAGDCTMLCGGDQFAYCGGSGRLNVYAAPALGGVSNSTVATGNTPNNTPPVAPAPTSATVSASTTAASASTSAASASTSAASSSAAASPTGAPSPWKYLGCANETDNRSLSGIAISGTMTPETCQDFCFTNNFPLAGTEFGEQCFCGTALQNGATINQTGCDMACSGDPSKTCGGMARLSVYNYTMFLPTIIVPSVGTYLAKGCYTEGTSMRALDGFAFANMTLTTEQCVTTCEGKSFAFAGVEYGSECYCGNAISSQSTKVVDDQCNMPCGGNKRTYCGAGK